MNRSVVLGVLVAVGVVSMTIHAAQQPAGGQPAPRVVEVEKLRDNLYLMKGGGGNSAVFITANGVVVVDTKNPGWGQPLLDKIKSVTDKPVTTIINTHTHGDHVSGNVEFPATVEVVTHENTKANMEHMRIAVGHHAGAGRSRQHLQGERRPRHAQAHVQGPHDAGQRQRPHRAALLRARPHQRRRVGGVPGAQDRARRRHLLRQEHPAARRRERRQRPADWRHACQGRRRPGRSRGHHHRATAR